MFIFNQDKSFVVMPVCYHPTTVLAVDDEKDFLDALETDVSDHLSLLCFYSPNSAIEYVKNSRELRVPFAARLHFTGKSDTDLCGFSRMLESTIQDFIHPFPKDLDMSFFKLKQELNNNSPEYKIKTHKTFDDFKCSQYILTETSFYYYNKLNNECKWISSDNTMLRKLNNIFLNETDELDSNQLEKITDMTQHHRPPKLGFSIIDIRNEIYNKYRLKEIIMVTTDYDMPDKTGIEFIKTVAFPGITLEHVLIIITGKNSEEFKRRLSELSLPPEYIVKEEPEWVDKLLRLIEEKTSRIFQDCSQKVLRILSEDTNEEACFVFDKEFGHIFTSHLRENNICELYLFDRQGSYLLLDENANLSWFIIRSEKGMENSIQKAIEYEAPQSVIDALRTRKVVLSLYEEQDFYKFKKKLMTVQLQGCSAEVMSDNPNEFDRKKVIEKTKVLFIAKENGFEICYCSNNEKYTQESINDDVLIERLRTYREKQNIEDAEDLVKINAYLASRDVNIQLESQEKIEKKKELYWGNYLNFSSVFESKTNRLDALGIKFKGDYFGDKACKYYYAFIKNFPENGIDKNKILSYKEFLDQSAYD